MESWDGKWLFYTVTEATSVLRKQSLVTGQEEDVVPEVATVPGFVVTADGIYYLTQRGNGATLSFLDFASRISRQLAAFDKPPGNGLSVSADGKHILLALCDNSVSNLMLLRDFSNGRHAFFTRMLSSR